MSEKVEIEGLDLVEVLRALYAGASPQGLGLLHAQPGDLTKEQAAEELERCSYGGHSEGDRKAHVIDYVVGRPCKVTLIEGEAFDSWLYDRDNGHGRAANQIAALRERGGVWCE